MFETLWKNNEWLVDRSMEKKEWKSFWVLKERKSWSPKNDENDHIMRRGQHDWWSYKLKFWQQIRQWKTK